MDKEIYNKISKCNSIEEVLELAKTNNKNISREEAERIFETTRKHNGNELNEEELSNVSGGSGCGQNSYKTVYFQTREEAEKNYIFEINQRVELYIYESGSATKNVRIKNRKIDYDDPDGYYDVYLTDTGEKHSPYNRWYCRWRFQK